MIDKKTEDQIKERLLQSLIDHMDDRLGEKLSPRKEMSVEVAAPDKDKLVEGLSKAKDLMASDEIPMSDEDAPEVGSDEDRLMDLANIEEDDDEDDRPSRRFW